MPIAKRTRASLGTPSISNYFSKKPKLDDDHDKENDTPSRPAARNSLSSPAIKLTSPVISLAADTVTKPRLTQSKLVLDKVLLPCSQFSQSGSADQVIDLIDETTSAPDKLSATKVTLPTPEDSDPDVTVQSDSESDFAIAPPKQNRISNGTISPPQTGTDSADDHDGPVRRRPRAAQRISYAAMLDDGQESDDDLAVPAMFKSRLSHKRKSTVSRRHHDDDDSGSQFGSDASDAVSDEDLDDDDLAGDLEEGDPDDSDSDEFSDILDNSPRSKKKARSSAAVKTKIVKVAKTAGKPGYVVKSTAVKMSRSKVRMINLASKAGEKGIARDLPPMFRIADIFNDITARSMDLGMKKAVRNLKGHTLRVATMCSGTESPLLAMGLINDALKTLLNNEAFSMVHLFSAEIEPFKQAYIERNFAVPVIFRDITELTKAKDKSHRATTAYGSQVDIPDKLDLLIAGTACVDFSGLNAHKKDLSDKGESGDTFRAVLAYAKLWRPRILILENVFNAPWDEMMAAYDDENYATAGVLCDTKMFYLPQTRQRGYMVCLDKNSYKNADKKVEKWEQVMQALRRRASSPVTDFLLPNDDPSVIGARMLRARNGALNENTREVDWSKCAIRHIQYRQNARIGQARPFTSWQESGTVSVPDYADREWHSRQVERIWDMQDCSVLRKAIPDNGNYDACFKTRIWDLSQGVDRFQDTTPFGIASCLTPTGIFFLTDRGGPLTQHETLILQGLPIDRISFTTETAANIQDLAGNAMSSTVVGSTIVAALIAAYESEPPSGDVDIEMHDADVNDMMTHQEATVIAPPSPVRKQIHTPETFNIDVDEFMREAALSSSKCACEGPNDITPKSIQTCQECGHTSCLACGNKPVHEYNATHLHKRDRTAPVDFMIKWSSKMPSQFGFQGTCTGKDNEVLAILQEAADCNTDLKTAFFKVLVSCLESTFSYQKFQRSRQWTVTYDCPAAQLLLVADGTSCEWQLFAKPDPSLPGGSALRQFLAKPIAVMDAKDLTWRFRVPCTRKTKLSITGQGVQIASWMARLNLPSYGDQKVWSELRVEAVDFAELDIAGTYKHLPQCGTACESLYRRVDASDHAAPRFMLVDPDRIGDPGDDSVVFAADPERLQIGSKRRTVLELAPHWRPWNKQDKKFTSVEAFTNEIWVATTMDQVLLSPLSIKLDLLSSAVLGKVADDCTHMDMMFSVSFDASAHHASPLNTQAVINNADKNFFLAHGWIFQPLNAHLALSGWQQLSVADLETTCEACVPPMPNIRWKLGGTDGKALRPYEDSVSATTFEKCLKHRPDLFSITKETEKGVSKVTLGLNVASLAHRAIGRLQRIDCTTQAEQAICWTVDPAYTESSAVTFPAFTLMSNDRDKSFRDELDLHVDLWPKQQQALAWMLTQEQDQGQVHVIEEAAEARLPHLNWRAEVRASKEVHIRGGIQASHPGFGKTICTLALVQTDFQDRNAKQIISEMKDTPETEGCIKIAATLILAPKHLVKQWREEVDKVLGKNVGKMTIMIQTANDLFKYKISQFKQARIIIVSQEILTTETYIKKIALFAGIPEPTSIKGGREFKTWLEFARTEIKEHLAVLETKGARALASVIKDKFKGHLDDETFQAVIPSKRLKGRAYAEKEWNTAAVKGQKSSSSSTKVDPDSIDKCLFEMFVFNRIVVDEFTYLTSKDFASVMSIKADKRWILSATARLQDPYDIARMASLIGVKLRVGENASGALSTRNLKAIRSEMTDFELFQTFRDAPSAAITQRTYELAQIFLDNFVRQNILEFDEFPYEDHVKPVSIGLSHRVVYTELSQHLNSQDMRIKKGRKGLVEERDRENRLFENLKDVESAEEALSRLAAIFGGDNEAANGDVAALLKKRRREHKTADERLLEAVLEGQSMTVAVHGKEVAYHDWKVSVLEEQAFGDADTTARIKEMIESAEKKHGKYKVPVKDKKSDDGAGPKETKNSEAFKVHVSKTNTLAKQYLATGRSIRFVQHAQELRSFAQNVDDREYGCDCRDCPRDREADMAVSALCGHTICGVCLETLKTNLGLCTAEGCKAPVADYHLLRASKLRESDKDEDAELDEGDAKISSVMQLLSRIQKNKQQAILFVRYEDQIEELQAACNAHSIRCKAVRDNNSAAQQVTDFQKQLDPKTWSTAIILNAGNSSAAGVNLTNANHVLFLSPLLTDAQYDYEAQMAQAVGRVRRPGQTRDIHVYRFVSLDTIDVDILEHRERRDSPLSEQGADPVEPALQPRASDVDVEADTDGGAVVNTGAADKREKCQLIRGSDGVFRLMPKSWLVGQGALGTGVEGRVRVRGYEDFSSLVKFSKAYSED